MVTPDIRIQLVFQTCGFVNKNLNRHIRLDVMSELTEKIDSSIEVITRKYVSAKMSSETLYDDIITTLFNNIKVLKAEIEKLEQRIKIDNTDAEPSK